jgi:hypothetical protein
MGAGKRLTLQQLQVRPPSIGLLTHNVIDSRHLGLSCMGGSHRNMWALGCLQAQFGCGLKEAASNLGICPTSACLQLVCLMGCTVVPP